MDHFNFRVISSNRSHIVKLPVNRVSCFVFLHIHTEMGGVLASWENLPCDF